MTKHQKYLFFSFFDLLYFIISYFTYELLQYINYNNWQKMVPVGIEPTTFALLARRSNQTEL